MKKLIALILFLALAVPAISLADEPLYIDKHYSLFINSHEGLFVSGKGGKIFTFDSYTLDLYLCSDQKTGYMIETTYADGIFLNSGMAKVSLVDFRGTLRIVDDAGNNFPVEWDENGRDLWVSLDRGNFRMHLIDPIDGSADWH